MIRITVWNEFRHEKDQKNVAAIYPRGIHMAIAEMLEKEADFTVRTATMDEPECGLPQEVLDNTDVLFWWGHGFHQNVPDEVVARVVKAVQDGMGFVVLHSGHNSKPFHALMGTPCNLHWRLDGDMERVWVANPAHPIVQGIGRYFELPHEEVYCEPFAIPRPEETILIGWYEGGEVFRSGCTYTRGSGKIFYFQPGHEEYPTYYIPEVQTILKNAARYVAPARRIPWTGGHPKKIGT